MASPVFVIGCPRSGTHFVAELFRQTPGYSSWHCDDVDRASGDSFLEYARWYDLPVHTNSLINFRQHRVRNSPGVYVESNCYLSLFARELHEALDAQIVLLVREPKDVINSLWVKGWYEGPIECPPTFDYEVSRPSHSFGRFVPSAPSELERWKRLTRVGRIAWYYNALNRELIDGLRAIPSHRRTVLRVDECDYSRFSCFQESVGNQRAISKERFDDVVRERPGRASRHRTCDDWTVVERMEFEDECREINRALETLSL